MSAFLVKDHLVEAQHIREYARATAHSQEEVLYVAVKQYIPKNNLNPKPGDVTIIASHANGFVKELYEPLWEDLVTALGKQGVKVRGVWIADVAWQGQSGIVNEDRLGNDPSWLDHARDLLNMVNHFRRDIVRPIIGVGHSFGASIIANLSLLHPRLLSTLVLLDPVLSNFKVRGPAYGFDPMKASSFRREVWDSREEAAASFRRNKFYQTWDPRVLDAWVKYGLRESPSKLFPEPGKTILTTTKHQEIFTYYRPQAQVWDKDGKRILDRSKLPDAGKATFVLPDFPFYRPEGPLTTDKLPFLRPGVLWIFGGQSNVNGPDTHEEKMQLTGVGVGGSGGAAASRVKGITIEEFGHLVPMEATTQCAQYAADFIVPELKFWREEEEDFQRWAKRPDIEKQILDEDWKRWIGPLQKRPQKL
ncbi:alpha/beta-hydrolase [Thozetella sp. PMI_491]|nr:alpha/beta-hydrolase [Thozetella sp. PMI_491]